MESFETENLLFAAALISGGARLDGPDAIRYAGRRKAAIRLDTTGFSPSRLPGRLRELADKLSDLDDQNLEWLLEDSVLGDLDIEYQRLKRRVISGRPR